VGGVKRYRQREFKHKKASLTQMHRVLTVVAPGICLLRDELRFIVHTDPALHKALSGNVSQSQQTAQKTQQIPENKQTVLLLQSGIKRNQC